MSTNGGNVAIDIDAASNGSGRTNGGANELTPLVPLVRNFSAQSLSDGSVQSIRALPGMKIRAHSIDGQGHLTDCTTKRALGRSKKGTGSYWIDIDADDRDADELREWLGQLNLSPFLLSRLAEPANTWASQVLPFRSAALAVVQILPEKESSDQITHLAALCMRNLLLTFTSCPRAETGGLYATVHEYMHDRKGLPDASSNGALFAWLLFHIERTSRAAREIREYILRLDESMDRDVSSVSMDEIIGVKEQLLRVLSVAEEQSECLEALAVAEADSDGLEFSRLRGTMGVLRATAGATERRILRLEKHIADLRQRYETYHQKQMNRRLAVLTVLSAIFLPLTLLTGIWGMNFEDMPELQKPDAYPIALLVMILIAATMCCYFRRAGWFD
eukprot:CAMPEP_0197435566 /NCGR_PEP_ID=MMETSP1175-20131217/3139_1 /TAXON_ID=1003142 /ORGANISM="Triceratium dubium, Strain CCMP147" /LENGTH=389 /DNA_ID=CAMNT_0042964631 /DNA_START=128 /DNA_END=1297 /DNA_ORIENTATION=-